MIAPILFSALALAAPGREAIYPPQQPIWGTNVVTSSPAVLWYEAGRLYNSSPYNTDARSHWDEIAWEGDWLVYRATEAVSPLAPKRVEFTDGIRYLPRFGDKAWRGSTRFTSESGNGLLVYAASVRGGFMRIDELMLWDAGWITQWAENYEFRNGNLWHTWGGNATGADSWDITFTRVGP